MVPTDRQRAALAALADDNRLSPLQRQYIQTFLTKDPYAGLIGWHRRRPVVRGTIGGMPGERADRQTARHDTVLCRGGAGLADLSPAMADGDSFERVR